MKNLKFSKGKAVLQVALLALLGALQQNIDKVPVAYQLGVTLAVGALTSIIPSPLKKKPTTEDVESAGE